MALGLVVILVLVVVELEAVEEGAQADLTVKTLGDDKGKTLPTE